METVLVETTVLVEQKPLRDAILFTVSGITILVELFLENFGTFCQFSYIFYAKSTDFLEKKSVKTQEKSQTEGEKS